VAGRYVSVVLLLRHLLGFLIALLSALGFLISIHLSSV